MALNPVYATINRNPATAVGTDRLTMSSVISRFGLLMSIVIIAAGATWQYVATHPSQEFMLNIGAIVAALAFGVIAMLGTYGQVWAMFAYALSEGVLVGVLSHVVDARAPGHHLASTAVLATLCVFAVAFVLVASGIVRVGRRFTTFLMFALAGYAVFGLVNLVLQLTHVVGGWGLYSLGPIGIALSVIGVALASLTLVTSLSQITTRIESGDSVRSSWMCAHGLVVDIVWLYLEILRFLSLASSND